MPIALAAGLLGALAIAAPAGATFPGANGRIAIEGPPCCAHGDSHGFYTIPPNGHGLRLTRVGLTGVRDVAWSPDGTRVAFVADSGDPTPPEGDPVIELYTAAADGSDVRRLTRNRLTERTVSWSPDGRSLAFITTDAGGTSPEQLAVIPARGGKARLLRRVDAITAEWSPDGETIAIGEPFAGIQLIPVAGGKADTIAPGADARHFSWAPSGRALVFASCAAEYCDLFRVNGDGTGLEPLLQRTSSTDYIGQPVWSPDGETIAFCRGLDDVQGVWTMGADGRDPHLLRRDSPACGHWLSWRPVVPPTAPCRAPAAGTPRPDLMTGGPDYDTLAGAGGGDQLFGGGGPDCLLGGRGADVLRGGPGGDRLVGGRGNDRLAGGPGPDRIIAGRGRDRVRGGLGADSVDTRGGEEDVVDCGPGDDSAVVSASDAVVGCEHVTVAVTASR
jgi:hypothetical protein